MLARMANILDNLKAVASWAVDGASRAVGSFAERARRHSQRPPRHPGVGASLMSATLSGSSLYGYPGNWSSQRINQVMHFRHWSYIAIRAIMNHVSGLTPHVGWVLEDKDYQRSFRKSYGRRTKSHDSYLRNVRYRKSNHAIHPH